MAEEPTDELYPEGLPWSLQLLRARRLARRALTRPRWFLETMRLTRHRKAHARTWSHGDSYAPPHQVDVADAVAAVLGTDVDLCERPLDASVDVGTAFRARDELLVFVDAVIRAETPGRFLEVGVAHGASSAAILSAMEEVGTGRLDSIDLPPLHLDTVGDLVPQELRHRWRLTLGPSAHHLREVARRCAPLDVFLHDGDHTYPVQMEDFRVVWPHLRVDGVFIVDDVCNPAFVDFATEVGRHSVIVRKSPRGWFGVIRKGAD